MCFDYFLNADLPRLLIPALTVSAAKDNLWERSCFEAFIAVEGEKAYHEYNFSPSRQWAMYAFADYRERVAWQTSQSPTIKRQQKDTQLSISVTLPAACLPANPEKKNVQVGVSAVIETRDGDLSYWALKHPSHRPDFHHRESFTLSIKPFNRVML
ncbi:MAG: hypothetical protein DSZ29_02025 [Aquificaceae bacterium]|nr:MAG: hypothetical protein DSZ29_02025 [Aquificaceae bacterium]